MSIWEEDTITIHEGIARNLNVLRKFIEWNTIAVSNRPLPFAKQMFTPAKYQRSYRGSDAGSDAKFSWSGKKALLSGGNVWLCSPAVAQAFIELLNQVDDMRKEWKAKSVEIDGAFK